MVSKIHMDLKTFVFAAGARTPTCVCTQVHAGGTWGAWVKEKMPSAETLPQHERQRSPDVVAKRRLQRPADLGQFSALLLGFCVPL